MKTMCIDNILFNQLKQKNICFLLGYVHDQESRFVNDKWLSYLELERVELIAEPPCVSMSTRPFGRNDTSQAEI